MAKLKTGSTPEKLALDWAKNASNIFRKFQALGDAGKSPNAEEIRGFLDGIRGTSIPHPYEGIAPVRLEMGVKYCAAYDCGQSFANAATIFP